MVRGRLRQALHFGDLPAACVDAEALLLGLASRGADEAFVEAGNRVASVGRVAAYNALFVRCVFEKGLGSIGGDRTRQVEGREAEGPAAARHVGAAAGRYVAVRVVGVAPLQAVHARAHADAA